MRFRPAFAYTSRSVAATRVGYSIRISRSVGSFWRGTGTTLTPWSGNPSYRPVYGGGRRARRELNRPSACGLPCGYVQTARKVVWIVAPSPFGRRVGRVVYRTRCAAAPYLSQPKSGRPPFRGDAPFTRLPRCRWSRSSGLRTSAPPCGSLPPWPHGEHTEHGISHLSEGRPSRRDGLSGWGVNQHGGQRVVSTGTA